MANWWLHGGGVGNFPLSAELQSAYSTAHPIGDYWKSALFLCYCTAYNDIEHFEHLLLYDLRCFSNYSIERSILGISS